MGITSFPEEEHVGNIQNMSKILPGSINDTVTQSITIDSTWVVSTEGSNT